MAPDVAEALARLGQRERWVGEDDLVFPGEVGIYLDGSALQRRDKYLHYAPHEEDAPLVAEAFRLPAPPAPEPAPDA